MENESLAQERLLDHVSRNPMATIGEIAEAIGVKSRNTVHWHVRKLETAGRLKRPEIRRDPWIVYADKSRG